MLQFMGLQGVRHNLATEQLGECLFWRNVYLGLLPIFLIGLFVFLILSCMRCLYILEINPLSVAFKFI